MKFAYCFKLDFADCANLIGNSCDKSQKSRMRRMKFIVYVLALPPGKCALALR